MVRADAEENTSAPSQFVFNLSDGLNTSHVHNLDCPSDVADNLRQTSYFRLSGACSFLSTVLLGDTVTPND
jgi:hypothetical protein